MPKPQKQHAADDIECGDSPAAHSAPALRAPSKPSEELLGRVSDDLTSKMRAWAQQIDAQYMHVDDPATHSLRVSVLAATGIEHVSAPFWLAAVSGSVAETAEPTPLAEPMTPGGSPPAGTPSWQAEALTLRVHDVTADLLLFLCEADGTDASRACVGRVVVPLTELLPRLPCVGQPPPRRFWAEIFPAAPEYALGQVHTTYAPAVPEVACSGMLQPTMAHGRLVRPPARALLEIALEIDGSLLGAYCMAPPFDAHAEHPGSERHERPPLPPERLLLAAQRVGALANSLTSPAAIRLSRDRPWSMSACFVGLAYAACYHVCLPLLPAWFTALYLVNAAAIRILGHDYTEPWEPEERTGRSDAAQHARATADGAPPAAAERLRTLEDTILPLVCRVEEWCAHAERLASAPLAEDLRAAALASMPLLLGLLAATLVCTMASIAVLLAGGAANAAFGACVLAVLAHLASYHHRELQQCSGGTGAASLNEARYDDALLNAARSNPFAGRGAVAQPAADSILADFEGADQVASWWHNAWLRVPDEPTRVHRAMARAALQPAPLPGAEHSQTRCGCIPV